MITGDEIRFARKRARWSQAQLAVLVGVVERTIGGWERGESAPGLSEAKLLEVLSPYLGPASGEIQHLHGITDVELLAEIARRFSRTSESEGTAHGDNAAEKIPVTPRRAVVKPKRRGVSQKRKPPDPQV